MFTNNPEWTFVRDRGDTRQINGGDGYDRWVRVRIFNIDWSARQAEFEWEDQQSGTLETGTVSLGSNGTDVEEVYFTASYKGPSNGGYTGGAVSCNWDAITIKTSGSSSTLTEEALREGVAVNEESTKSTRVSHGRVQSPTSQSTKTENLNFEPDVVQFRVTSTNSQFNNVTRPETTDFGWGHGVAKFNEDGSTEQYAVSHGSGSNSTNGHISEASSVYGVLQLVTDVSGDNLRGKVEASVKKAGKGFELEFTEVQEQQQILYTAYKFGGGDVDVGFFNAPNSSGTKSITEPGFQPNFLRLFATPSLNSMDSTNNELSNGTDVGWGQGVAVENSSGVKQGSLAVSQFTSNIDGHAYTSSDTDVFSIAFMNGKTTLDGTAKGSVSFTNNGFDINFGTVNAPNNETPLTVYLAADSVSEPDAGFEKTPTGTGSVSYSTDTDLDNLCVFSSNTIPAFNQERGVASQTWGWNYGQLNNATDTQQIGFYSSSNSVNGHGFSADNILYRSIYTNQSGNEQGRVEGDISSIGSSSFSINYSTVSTDSSNGSVEGDTEAFAYYGFGSGEISTGLGVSVNKVVGQTLTKSFSESVQTVAAAGTLVSEFFDLRLIQSFSVFDEQNAAKTTSRVLSESVSNFADVTNFGRVVGPVPQDGVFNTGRFDQATFNTLRRGETPDSLAQVSTFKVDGVPLSVNLFVSDADVLNAGINLFENQFIADAESTAAEKPLNEVSNVSENFLKTVIILKSASFAASDQEVSRLSKPFVESVSSADTLSKLPLKELSEVSTLSDAESFRVSKPLSETSLLSDVVLQTSSLQRLFELSVTSDDSTTKEPGLTLGESVDAVDSVRQVSESFRVFTEQVVAFSDADKQVSKPLSEGFISVDLIGREAVKSLTQRVSVSDSDISNISQALTESFAAASTPTPEQAAQRTLLESAALNDVEQMKVFRGITQQVGSLADLSFFFGTSVAESASPQDSESRLFSGSRDLQASVDVADFFTDDLAVIISLAESANLQDVERSESDLSRAFAEEQGVTGSVRKQLARSISESAAASDLESVLYATSLAESQGLSDATSAVVSSVLRQDAGVGDEVQPTAELLRVFSEAVSSSDEERFTASQPLTESSSPVASFSRVSQRFRSLAEDVVSADNSSLRLARVLFEEFVSDDVPRVEASLFRLFAESLQVQSSVREFRAFRVFGEGVEPADVFAKRLDTALSEAASASDEVVREAGLRRRRRAELFVSDSDIFDFQKPLFESAAAQDSFESEASLFRDFEQAPKVADLERVETRRELAESSGLVDEVQRAAELLRFLGEDAELVDAESVLAGRRFGEDVGVVDAESLKASLELEQGVDAEDFESFLLEKAILESVSQFSEAGSEAELLRSVFEAFSASDRESALVSKLLAEVQSVEDSESVSVFRLLGESARLQLGFSRDAVFRRSVLQGLSVIDIETVFSQRVFTEGLAAVDSLAFALRRALDAGFSVSDVLSLLVPAETVPDAVDLAALRVAVAELSKTRRAFADLEAKTPAKA